MLLEVEKKEYDAFQEWKAANCRDAQFEQERLKSLQPFNVNMMKAISLFNMLAVAIQNHGKACAFVRVYGHIQCVQITIHKGGWYTNKGYDFDITAYTFEDNLEYVKTVLVEKIGELDILPIDRLQSIINQ